jgi:hypothetical protein
MSLTQRLTALAARSSREGRSALVAECGTRVLPVYENYCVGAYVPAVARAVEIGWLFATGAGFDEGEARRCLSELEEVIEFYSTQEEIELLRVTVTVAERVLESVLTDENDVSCLATARGLWSTLDVAQHAEAMANTNSRVRDRPDVALEQERAWQNAALARIDGWNTVATRDMFASLGPKPAVWLQDWLSRAHHM